MRYLRSRSFDVHQTEVDVLPALGLMAMNGDDVFAGLERCLACRGQWKETITSDKPGGSKGEHAVDINFCVFIVMDPGFQCVVILDRQINFTAEPDVVGLPCSANDCARRASSAETALALLPG